MLADMFDRPITVRLEYLQSDPQNDCTDPPV